MIPALLVLLMVGGGVGAAALPGPWALACLVADLGLCAALYGYLVERSEGWR